MPGGRDSELRHSEAAWGRAVAAPGEKAPPLFAVSQGGRRCWTAGQAEGADFAVMGTGFPWVFVGGQPADEGALVADFLR